MKNPENRVKTLLSMIRGLKPEFVITQLLHCVRDAIATRKAEDELGLYVF